MLDCNIVVDLAVSADELWAVLVFFFKQKTAYEI